MADAQLSPRPKLEDQQQPQEIDAPNMCISSAAARPTATAR